MNITFENIQMEIDNAFSALDDIDNLTDEQRDEAMSALGPYLDELARAEADKADAIGFVFKRRAADVKFLREEAKRLSARAGSMENGLDWMRGRILQTFKGHDLQKIKGARHTIYLGKSSSLDISDPESIPDVFKETRTEVVINKPGIKTALTDGIEVPGARLVKSEFVVIR